MTLTFAAYAFQQPHYKALIDTFEQENPHIRVRFVPLAFDPDGETKLNPQTLAATADTFLLPTPPQNNPFFTDLTPFAQADMAFAGQDFWPGVREGCGTSGLPVGVSPEMIFLDGNAFTAADLSLPERDWTWDEFVALAERLAQVEGGQTIRYGFVPLINHPVMAQAAVRALLTADEEGSAERLADEIAWYTDWVGDGVMPATFGLENEPLIASGQAAMWSDTIFALSNRQQALEGPIHVLPFPSSETENSTPIRVSCAAISAATAHPQAAWRWLNYLTFHPNAFVLPARPSLFAAGVTSPNLPEDVDAAILQFALLHGWYGRQAPIMLALETGLTTALGQDADKVTALTAALDNVTAEANGTELAEPVAVNSPVPNTAQNDRPVITFHEGRIPPFLNYGVLSLLAREFDEAHPEFEFKVINNISSGQQGSPGFSDLAAISDCFTTAYLFDESLLLPLDPLLENDSDNIAADWWPGSEQFFAANGRLYGLPLTISPPVIYYNIDLLSSLGLEQPTTIWTFGDFLTLAEAAKRKTSDGEPLYGFVLLEDNPDFDFDFLLSGRNASRYYVEQSPPQVFFNTSATISNLNWLNDLIVNGTMPTYTPYRGAFYIQLENKDNHNYRQDLVQAGRAAMWSGIGGFTKNMGWAQRIDFEYGVAPPPLLILRLTIGGKQLPKRFSAVVM